MATIPDNGLRVNVKHLETCYKLMGNIDPCKWDMYTTGDKLRLVLIHSGLSTYMLEFNKDKICVSKQNCMGKTIAKDTLPTSSTTSMDLLLTMREIWGNTIHIPEFKHLQ